MEIAKGLNKVRSPSYLEWIVPFLLSPRYIQHQSAALLLVRHYIVRIGPLRP